MKKLLLTTALAGAMISTSAMAQTTISGGMIISYGATSEKGAAGAVATSSKRSFGQETQLNLANKGKLNVGGLNYEAGFSLEFDANDLAGTSTSFKSVMNENAYIDLIAGTTRFSFGIDHLNDSDRNTVPVVGESFRGTGALGGVTVSTNAIGGNINTSAAQGFNVQQTLPGIGRITLGYNPTATCSSTDAAGCGSADTSITEGNEGSAYSYLFELIDLGTKGLNVEYMHSEQQKKIGSTTTPTRDAKSISYGARYTAGPLSVGAMRHEFTHGNATVEKNKQSEIGLAYTVGNLSYGVTYGKVTSNLANTVDEKMTGVGIGYNLGPVAAKVGVSRHKDVGGSSGADADVVKFKLTTAF